jgi:hypothetical protein
LFPSAQLPVGAQSQGIVAAAIRGQPVEPTERPPNCKDSYDELRLKGVFALPSNHQKFVPILTLLQIDAWCKVTINSANIDPALLHFATILSEMLQLRSRYDWFDFEIFHFGELMIRLCHIFFLFMLT